MKLDYKIFCSCCTQRYKKSLLPKHQIDVYKSMFHTIIPYHIMYMSKQKVFENLQHCDGIDAISKIEFHRILTVRLFTLVAHALDNFAYSQHNFKDGKASIILQHL